MPTHHHSSQPSPLTARFLTGQGYAYEIRDADDLGWLTD
jgi:hypothetical protein